VQAHAELGSRSDMIARIPCGNVEPGRVLVPNSGKGRNRHKATSGTTSVPVVGTLAARFAALARGRPADALLLTDNGQPWTANRTRRLVIKAVAKAKLPAEVTLIWLRHSSIVRALDAKVDHQTVADWHNTSVRMLETNYARYMRGRHDEKIRRALFQTAPLREAA
jgi:site-specific recombinase XerD